jgi:protein-L-isoaspartate(D-aspartate) O-methyltransferase
MTDFARARTTMVDTQLRTSSVTDRRILGAMGRVARERFVPDAWRDLAYLDDELPLGASDPARRMPAPAPFARLVQLADIAETDRALILACGTGYSAAVIAELAASVVAVEPDLELANRARENLASLGLTSIPVRTAPIDAGAPKDGPFDVIVVEAVVPEAPKALLGQLKDHGRLVALIGTGMTAVAHIFVRSGKEVAGRADFNARLPAVAHAPERDAFVF